MLRNKKKKLIYRILAGIVCLFLLTGCGNTAYVNSEDGVNIITKITPLLECYDYNLIIESEDETVSPAEEDSKPEPDDVSVNLSEKTVFNIDEPIEIEGFTFDEENSKNDCRVFRGTYVNNFDSFLGTLKSYNYNIFSQILK